MSSAPQRPFRSPYQQPPHAAVFRRGRSAGNASPPRLFPWASRTPRRHAPLACVHPCTCGPLAHPVSWRTNFANFVRGGGAGFVRRTRQRHRRARHGRVQYENCRHHRRGRGRCNVPTMAPRRVDQCGSRLNRGPHRRQCLRRGPRDRTSDRRHKSVQLRQGRVISRVTRLVNTWGAGDAERCGGMTSRRSSDRRRVSTASRDHHVPPLVLVGNEQRGARRLVRCVEQHAGRSYTRHRLRISSGLLHRSDICRASKRGFLRRTLPLHRPIRRPVNSGITITQDGRCNGRFVLGRGHRGDGRADRASSSRGRHARLIGVIPGQRFVHLLRPLHFFLNVVLFLGDVIFRSILRQAGTLARSTRRFQGFLTARGRRCGRNSRRSFLRSCTAGGRGYLRVVDCRLFSVSPRARLYNTTLSKYQFPINDTRRASHGQCDNLPSTVLTHCNHGLPSARSTLRNGTRPTSCRSFCPRSRACYGTAR